MPAFRSTPAALASLLACVLALHGGPASAQGAEAGTITELKRTDLAGVPGMEVVMSKGEYKPGQGIPLHLHHGVESGYVLQGAMVQVPGKDPMMLPTGASILNLRDVPHGGFKVVGDTALVLLTVHVVDKGQPIYEPVK